MALTARTTSGLLAVGKGDVPEVGDKVARRLLRDAVGDTLAEAWEGGSRFEPQGTTATGRPTAAVVPQPKR